MNKLDAIREARALLENVTPLKSDCGRVCGGACCEPDEDGQGGMLLFPGEEALYKPLPEGFHILPDTLVIPDGKLLVCEGRCERVDRPLSCRLFPLLPTRRGAVMDRRGWTVCPLMEYGKAGLSGAFVEAVKQAGRLLYAEPELAAFLDAVHAFNRKLAEL